MRPGVNLNFIDAPPSAGAGTDTSTWFVAGLTERGPVSTATRVVSLADFQSKFGSRQDFSVLYDAMETYFREQGSVAYVSRVVGQNDVTSSVTLSDAADAPTLKVSAKDPGEWGDELTLDVDVVGSTFALTIYRAGKVVETAGPYASRAEAVAASQALSYVDIALQGTGTLPDALTGAVLANGDDDRASITNTDWEAALAAFNRDLGPGQVSLPGQTSTTLHQAQLAHASTTNRVALLDVPNTSVAATLKAAAVALQSDGNASYGALFGPWVPITGIAPGTTRTVPYSAIEAGIIARTDKYGNPGKAAAGGSYPSLYALSVPSFTDADREQLILAGVNLAKNVYGSIQTYGYRSVSTDAAWVQFNFARLRMALKDALDRASAAFVFPTIDGRGHTIAAFNAALSGVLLNYYTQDVLYGETPQAAYRVETGPTVNTVSTIAAGELHAQIGVKFSPHAEVVEITVSKTPLDQTI